MAIEWKADGVFVTEFLLAGPQTVTVADALMAKYNHYSPRTKGWGIFRRIEAAERSLPKTSDLNFDEVNILDVRMPSDGKDHVIAEASWASERYLIRDDTVLLQAPVQKIRAAAVSFDFTSILAVTEQGNQGTLYSLAVREGLGADEVEVSSKILLEGRGGIHAHEIHHSVLTEGDMFWVLANKDDKREIYLLWGNELRFVFAGAQDITVPSLVADRIQRAVFANLSDGVTKLGVVDLSEGKKVQEFSVPRTLSDFRIIDWEDPLNPLWSANEEDHSFSVFQGDRIMARGLAGHYCGSFRTEDKGKALIAGDKKDGGALVTLNGVTLFEDGKLNYSSSNFKSDENINFAALSLYHGEKENRRYRLFYLIPGKHGLLPYIFDNVKSVEVFEDHIEASVVRSGQAVKMIIKPDSSTGEPEVLEEAIAA